MKRANTNKPWGKPSSARLALGGIVAGISLGILGLLFPRPLTIASEFTEGLLGINEPVRPEAQGLVELRAEYAHSALDQPLSGEQFSELLRGIAAAHSNQPTEGIAVVGKYALLGDGLAQYVVGGLYAFGNGVSIDGEEARAWLELAAAQGHDGASQLAEVIESNPDWEARASYLASLRQDRAIATDQYVISTGPYLGRDASQAEHSDNRNSISETYLPRHSARREALLGEGFRSGHLIDPMESSTRYAPVGGQQSQTSIDLAPLDYGSDPLILNRAGPGTYSDQFGDAYVRAGPQGVINTRTGEFSPTN